MHTFTIRELRERSGDVTAARGAKLARMSLAQFLAHLSAQGINVVDYEPRELSQELAAFDVTPCSQGGVGGNHFGSRSTGRV